MRGVLVLDKLTTLLLDAEAVQLSDKVRLNFERFSDLSNDFIKLGLRNIAKKS